PTQIKSGSGRIDPKNGNQSRYLARRNLTSTRGSKRKGVDRFIPGVMTPHPVAAGMSGHLRPPRPKGWLALLREDSIHSIATRRRRPQESQNQAPCATQTTVDR